MDAWKQRAWLFLSLLILQCGWLSPSYAAKCVGRDLSDFFATNPISAALLGQVSFLFLAALPKSSSGNARDIQETACPSFRCVGFSRKSLMIGLPLGLLVGTVHTGWFASIPRTTVGMNTVLWNSDIVTTPLVHALVSLQLPSFGVVFGGVMGLLGVVFSMDSGELGNTSLGCTLCLSASLLYAVNAVIVEKLRKNDPKAPAITELLASEGLTALILLVSYAVATSIVAPDAFHAWCSSFPSAPWIALTLSSTLLLNIGWLWCTELAGASWAAMGACLSIPLAMVLDYMLLNVVPVPMAIFGACLILLGFVIVSLLAERYCSDISNMLMTPAQSADVNQSGGCRERWEGWFNSGAAPLLPAVDCLEEGPPIVGDKLTYDNITKDDLTGRVISDCASA